MRPTTAAQKPGGTEPAASLGAATRKSTPGGKKGDVEKVYNEHIVADQKDVYSKDSCVANEQPAATTARVVEGAKPVRIPPPTAYPYCVEGDKLAARTALETEGQPVPDHNEDDKQGHVATNGERAKQEDKESKNSEKGFSKHDWEVLDFNEDMNESIPLTRCD